MSDELRTKVKDFVKSKEGEKIGDGECFALADEALRDAGAKTAEDFGVVTETADYVWGEEIEMQSVQAGDVLQFKSHEATVKASTLTKIKFSDGASIEYSQSESRTFKRGHHTAVALGRMQSGKITVMEQNVKRGSNVVEKTAGEGLIYVNSSQSSPTKTKEKITINQAWAKMVKALFPKKADKDFIDGLLKDHNGKIVTADVTTNKSISVSGKIHAYQPVVK